jgi:hypothetical protein
MAASIDHSRTAPTIVPPAVELDSEAQALRAMATEKRILATKLQKEAAELDLAAAALEKRSRI